MGGEAAAVILVKPRPGRGGIGGGTTPRRPYMGVRDLLFIGLVLGGAAGLAASLYPPRLDARPKAQSVRPAGDAGLSDTVRRVDRSFRANWASESLPIASPAP